MTDLSIALAVVLVIALIGSTVSAVIGIAALFAQQRAFRDQVQLSARALAQGEEGLAISRAIKAQTLESVESAARATETLTELRQQELAEAKAQTTLLAELLASQRELLAALRGRPS
jgi:hypothetical protein